MKGLATIIATAMFISAYAQVPQKISYQAVVRNSNNELVVNQKVGLKITLLKGSASGAEVYTETQTPLTNASGLISIEFGGGAGFNTIDWGSGTFFIKTEVDPLGGSNYTMTGISQLLSVPYAFFSGSSDYNNLLHKPNLADTSKYIKKETDPIFRASVANGITANDISNWNAKSLTLDYIKHAYDSIIHAYKIDLLNELELTKPSGEIKDGRDNQSYKFVKIGDQIWFAENLNYYTKSGSTYVNNDSLTYASTYGRLYEWETAKHVCPSSWHLPSEDEFIQLLTYLGGVLDPPFGYPISGKLKEAGTTHWQSPNTNATNSSGFNAVPGGWWYSYNSTYMSFGQEARFWTSTEKFSIANSAAPFTLQHDSQYVRTYAFLANFKIDKLSVRCLKNK